ncbi:ABC transporter ATP-binding protein [Clostridium sp. D2Q-11]|uniref:ABC transporter ATP-binding protein n=1 Tax=Anaeromonas frigoriresistens TaxID=2683708 RepID=A0A942Z7S9_9FIRM|nr:ABC transporter ATP-binding protein [Anaeromonas frigoriresistens]MBS4537219.1 ABC transporter ATP-binding protein [Anaeromonas frigoriresistens]
MEHFKTLREFFIEHKKRYILGIIWLIIVDILQLIFPQILRRITDLLESNNLSLNGLLKYSLLIVLTGLGIALGRYFWRIYIQTTARKLEYYLRNRLFSHLQSLSTNYFNTHKTGDLMAHATNDINAVRMALGIGVVMVTDSIFITISALIMMVKTTNLTLSIIALFPLPFLAYGVQKMGKTIHNRFKDVQESFSDLSDRAQENFAGIRVVKSFVQENEEIKKFTEVNDRNFNKNMKLIKISGMLRPLIQFISALSFLIVIWYGGLLVIQNEISLGDFVAFNSYLSLLVWPMMAIGWVINILQRGAASMSRINDILFETPEVTDCKDCIIEKKDINGSIEFKDVSFKYPNSDEYALKNINIQVPKGTTLGIVGRTGSGKTTLVNLLLRLYDIDKGQILIDNLPLKKLPLKTIRENVGYVAQDNFLFSNTVAENIAFSFENKIDESKIYESAKIAEVYDNIIEFPDGFNTSLGERGVTMSGGQRQRTALARAIIKKPNILILDDSLSAVDTQTEEKILKNLKDFIIDRTNIIIAHRISTIKNADHIVVLDKGKIVESGTHNELVKNNGLYNNIYQKQLLEEKIQSI